MKVDLSRVSEIPKMGRTREVINLINAFNFLAHMKLGQMNIQLEASLGYIANPRRSGLYDGTLS